MGNNHTIKRRAEQEFHIDESPKRVCFNAADPFEWSASSRKRKQKDYTDDDRPAKKKIRIPSFLHFTAAKYDSIFEYGLRKPMDLRSRSLVEFQSISTNEVHSSENFYKSFVNLRRKEFPIPWLEALFLPEFPSRSAIGEKNFIISNEIGNGTFGNVYRVIAKNNSRGIYALKIQQKSLIIGKHAVQQVRQEIAVQRLLPSHVFIARLYVSWQTRSKLFSVFQYPVGGIGDMFNLWQEHGVLPEQSVRIYGAELACALDFLHDHDVIYRDLKLENVALDSIGHIKMVDFGLAKVLKNGDQTNTVCGTLQYMSPDVASEKPYSHCVDWWSLAVLLHILVTGKYPYPNSSATHHRHLKFIDYSTPVNCSTEFGDLMNKMLVFPSRREIRTFNEFRNHIFFKSIDFDDVTDLKYNPLDEILNSSQRNDQSDAIDWDGEESIKVFGEDYEFDEFDYFNDAI